MEDSNKKDKQPRQLSPAALKALSENLQRITGAHAELQKITADNKKRFSKKQPSAPSLLELNENQFPAVRRSPSGN